MNNSLDNLLKEWAARQEPDSARFNTLAGQIMHDVGRRTRVIDDEIAFTIPFSQKLRYAGLGAVAALVVCLLCMHVQVSVVPQSTGAGVPAFAAVSAQEVGAGAKLFTEMERLFSDHLKWVAQSNGDVGIGVEPEGSLISADSSGKPVLVRLTVLSRKTGEKEWRKAWNTDVVMRREQLVEIAPNEKSGNKLALWVYPLADGKLAVDTNIALVQPATIASRSNMVVAHGQVADIAQLRAGNEEYRVLQSVQVL